MRREFATVWRRLRRRLWVVVGVTVALAAVIVLWRARKQRVFEASIVIREVESDFNKNTTPPSKGQLTRYLNDIALSRTVLLGVVRDFDLYRDKMSFDESAAAEAMRDDVSLKVVQNYFSPERYVELAVRSARIVISYRGRAPQEALAVVRRLGKLVASEQTQARQNVSRVTEASVLQARRSLIAELSRLRQERAGIDRLPKKKSIEIVKLRRLTLEIADLHKELRGRDTQSAELALRTGLEENEMGLRFEIVDPGQAPRIMLTRSFELALLALLSAFFAFPLVGLGVCTLGSRVFDLESVRRLDLVPFGHIPAFSGDQVGSLEARMNARQP